MSTRTGVRPCRKLARIDDERARPGSYSGSEVNPAAALLWPARAATGAEREGLDERDVHSTRLPSFRVDRQGGLHGGAVAARCLPPGGSGGGARCARGAAVGRRRDGGVSGTERQDRL